MYKKDIDPLLNLSKMKINHKINPLSQKYCLINKDTANFDGKYIAIGT